MVIHDKCSSAIWYEQDYTCIKKGFRLTTILVIYYSAFGHVATLSEAIAKGVENVEGARFKRVRIPEFQAPSIRVVHQRNDSNQDGLAKHFKLTKRARVICSYFL